MGAAGKTYKPKDVEELVDLYFHRPLASILVSALQPTSISPNQVTISSGILGIIAGIVIGLADNESNWLVPVGGVFLLLSVVSDCADGQLARLRGASSLAGRVLDGFIDIVPVVSVFFGLTFYLLKLGYDPYYVWPVACAAGFSFRWQVEQYDHAKEVFLKNTRADAGWDTLPSVMDIDAEYQRLRQDGELAMAYLMLAFKKYTEKQRRGNRGNVSGLDQPVMQNEQERALYREVFINHMGLWTWNGIGTKHCLTYMAALMSPVWTFAVFGVWWIMILPMNILAFGLKLWSQRLENLLANRLNEIRLAESGSVRPEKLNT